MESRSCKKEKTRGKAQCTGEWRRSGQPIEQREMPSWAQGKSSEPTVIWERKRGKGADQGEGDRQRGARVPANEATAWKTPLPRNQSRTLLVVLAPPPQDEPRSRRAAVKGGGRGLVDRLKLEVGKPLSRNSMRRVRDAAVEEQATNEKKIADTFLGRHGWFSF